MKGLKRFYTIAGSLAILYLLIFFAYPLVKVAISSFYQNGSFHFDSYVKVFTEALYVKVLLKTLWISFLSTLLTLIIGYSLAYFIHTRKSSHQGFWLVLIISPMFVSLTIRLYGWMIFLSKGGPVSSFVSWATNDSVSILFNSFSVIIGIVHYVLPFVVINIYTALKKISPSVHEASTMLGASPARTFWKVTFPLSLPGVFGASSLAFSLSASTFLVPVMLGGPKDNMLANMVYNLVMNVGNIGMGATLSIVLLVIVIIMLSILGILERRGQNV